MRYLIHILYLVIYCQIIFGQLQTFYVNQDDAHSGSDGSSDSPYATIQEAIDAISESGGECEYANAYESCVDNYNETDCNDSIDCSSQLFSDNCSLTCNPVECINGHYINFAKVCTVKVVGTGTYLENLKIEHDMVIISDAVSDFGYYFDPSVDDTVTQLPAIQANNSSTGPDNEEVICIKSAITIRPSENIDYGNSDSPAYEKHPHVQINGFKIISGEGTSIKDNLSGQYKNVGGGIISYLAFPQLNNCKFELASSINVSGGYGQVDSDGDEIDYPSKRPPPEIHIRPNGCSDNEEYDQDNIKQQVEWPWDIDFSNNDFSIANSAGKDLTEPLFSINGLDNKTVNFNSCLFNVYNTNDVTTGVSEYWIKGRKKDGGKVTFNFSDSQTNKDPITSEIVNINPNLLQECINDVCGTIHVAMKRMVPSPGANPKKIKLPLGTFNGFSTIPIIDGISIEGTYIATTREKTILDAEDSGRIFTCQDMQNTNVNISNLEITRGYGTNGGDGGAMILDNCSATFENVKIDLSSSNEKGGALHLVRNSKPHFINVKITNNTSRRYGGGLSLDRSSPVISGADSEISNNTSNANKGAGIYSINGSAPKLHDVMVKNNNITRDATDPSNNESLSIYGAGIYIKDAIDENNRFNISNLYISGNWGNTQSTLGSSDFYGAGIYIDRSFGTIENTTIENNGICSNNNCTFPTSGGGLYVSNNSSVDLNIVNINNNYIDDENGSGNAIFFDEATNCHLNYVGIDNGERDVGQGIIVRNSDNIEFEHVIITGNTVYGIQILNSYGIEMRYVEITDNEIGIWSNYATSFTIQNLTMANNTWGITTSSSSFNIINSIIWNSPIHLSSNDDYQFLQVSYSNYGSDGDYESGEAGIVITGNNNNIEWDSTNLDIISPNNDNNPLFTNEENGDYSLRWVDEFYDCEENNPVYEERKSPCIDMGTALIDGDSLIVPDGNPDMGAYESSFDPTPTGMGDINDDSGFNILDITTLVNCVLQDNCVELENSCAGDINGDGGWNVLDIVTLANCVLQGNCNERVDDASYSELIIKDKMVSIKADGFIGGVQMTLAHGDNFKIEMTDQALFADYITEGNETRLLVITPETDELFSFDNHFEILDIIVANSNQAIAVDHMVVSAFSLDYAYPNPFNPSTNINFSVPIPSDIIIQIYDLQGRIVETLISDYKDAGNYTFTWHADTYSSGLYLVQMTALPLNNSYVDVFSATRKLLLIK